MAFFLRPCASTAFSLFLLLISLLLIQHSESESLVIELNTAAADAPPPSPPPQIDCDEACDARCQLSSRPRLCKRACGTCCARCHCVPPGTSGHYDACPCYANMTTHGGRHKCP